MSFDACRLRHSAPCGLAEGGDIAENVRAPDMRVCETACVRCVVSTAYPRYPSARWTRAGRRVIDILMPLPAGDGEAYRPQPDVQVHHEQPGGAPQALQEQERAGGEVRFLFAVRAGLDAIGQGAGNE